MPTEPVGTVAATMPPAQPSIYSLLDSLPSVKIVDIGANPIDGDPPYALLLRAGHAEVVGFEPNRDALEVLQQKKGPRETYLPHAIGDGRRHTLHITQAPGMTSLLAPNPDLLNLFHGFPEWSRVARTEDVDTVRLDDVPETAGVDLIKIDIQGAELMALSNAPQRLASALVVQTEVEFVPMYKDQPLYGDIERLLRGHGFLLHRFEPLTSRVVKPMLLGGNIRAGFNQVLWTDAIFVRDPTRLDALDEGQLLRTAILLHECWGSIDLALHFLLAHDKRTGQGLGQHYFAKITGRA
ncbi:MAG: FkbM family methyltransferase [Rhodospirillales bacterium]|nr:FkbM family methyltransferase [Rhodospirillales bacterium]